MVTIKRSPANHCKIFVKIETIPLNWKKHVLRRVQFFKKRRPRVGIAFEARKIQSAPRC